MKREYLNKTKTQLPRITQTKNFNLTKLDKLS